MVWKHEVHAAAVNVEVVAQIFASHGCALAMPSGKSLAPSRRPPHDVLGLRFLPQSEVHLVAFLVNAIKGAAVVYHVLKVASAELAVLVVAVIFLHVEVDAAVALVGIAVVEDFLHQLFLLDDVTCGMWLDAGWQHIERAHGIVIAVGVELCHFHGLELFEPCFFSNLVFTGVGIVFQVAHIGNVAHIAHLVAKVLEIAEQHVEGD